ncbi:hypothetical protein LINGRAHAP2_LOCUS344 [Linum grandiflorum]
MMMITSLGDGVDGVDDARDVTKDGKQQTDPELNLTTELEEHTQRRQQDRQDYVYAISHGVDDAREVAKDGEQQADPELNMTAELEEHSQRRKQDRQDYVYAVSRPFLHDD